MQNLKKKINKGDKIKDERFIKTFSNSRRKHYLS